MKFYSYLDGKTQFSQIFLGCIIIFFFGGGGGGGGGVTMSFTCGTKYIKKEPGNVKYVTVAYISN